ncbi:MAG TPA: DUF4249 family protein [Bacteroidales bacterium]|nr:DUF4249 family protein [Bacteroidales bacterium]
MKKILPYLFLLTCLSCEKKTEWPIQGMDSSRLVVDGMITNEIKAHSIRLTRTVNALNLPPDAVSGAGVIISDADSSWFLMEQPGHAGVYTTKNSFSAKPGTRYTLLVTVDGVVYSAKTIMRPNTPLTLLRYVKNANDNLYRITWVANPYNAVHPAMYEILLDWSHVPGYAGLPPDSCKAHLYYFSLPTIDVSQVFAPEMEKIYFPKGTKIIERKYSLNEEHVEFIRAMITETCWKGGLFESAPADVPTNISNDALGFFAACHVISDSMTVK